MKKLETKKNVSGKVIVPGSKSYTNRALVCSALAEGESIIENYGDCDDTQAMQKALLNIGVDVEKKDNNLIVTGHHPKDLSPKKKEIDLGPAETATRFTTGLYSQIKGD